MSARPRLPFWLTLASSVLIVILVGTALLLWSGNAWGPARAAPQALTAGQVAAIEGGNFILSGPTPVPPQPALKYIYMPMLQYHH